MNAASQPNRKGCAPAACLHDFHAPVLHAAGLAGLVWTVEADGTLRSRDLASGRDVGVGWGALEGAAQVRVMIAAHLRLWLGFSDGRVRVMEVQPRRVVAESAVHREAVNCLRYHRNFVYSAGDDSQVVQWDVATGQNLQSFTLPERVLSLALLNTTEINDVLFVGLVRSAVMFVDVTPRSTRPAAQPFGRHTAAVTALATREGCLWSGSDDCCVKVWRWPDAACQATLVQHDAPIRQLVSQGPHVWSAAADGSVVVWDAEKYNCLQHVAVPPGPLRAPPLLAHIGPWTVDCMWLGTTSGHGHVRVYASIGSNVGDAASMGLKRGVGGAGASPLEVTQLQQQLQDLTAKYRTTQAKERKVDERCDELEQECAAWRRRCADLEARTSQISDLSEWSGSSPTATTDSELRQQVAVLQREVDRLRSGAEAGRPREARAEAEAETLRAQLTQADAEIGRLRATLLNAQTDTNVHADLEVEMRAAHGELAEQERALQEQRAVIRDLKAQLSESHRQLQAAALRPAAARAAG
eukprot:EG_transcript_9098